MFLISIFLSLPFPSPQDLTYPNIELEPRSQTKSQHSIVYPRSHQNIFGTFLYGIADWLYVSTDPFPLKKRDDEWQRKSMRREREREKGRVRYLGQEIEVLRNVERICRRYHGRERQSWEEGGDEKEDGEREEEL
jgi:hypothetical protein